MSLILDALRKADAERQLGQLPDIHTQLFPTAVVEAPVSRWRWRVAGTGLAIVMILCVWLGWQSDRLRGMWSTPAAPVPAAGSAMRPVAMTVPSVPATPPASSAAAVPTAPTVTTAPTAQSVTLPPTPALSAFSSPTSANLPPASSVVPVPPPLPPRQPKSAIVADRDPAVKTPASKPSAVKAVPPKPAPVPATSTIQPSVIAGDASGVSPLPARRIPALAELPAGIQHELPAFSIGGSMYSKNPADRMVLVGKRMLHEGDEVTQGLVLESLLPKAAVFRYKGYQFQMAY